MSRGKFEAGERCGGKKAVGGLGGVREGAWLWWRLWWMMRGYVTGVGCGWWSGQVLLRVNRRLVSVSFVSLSRLSDVYLPDLR